MENRRKEKKRPWAPSKHQMVESISFCSRLSRGRFSSPFLDALSEGASRSPCATEKGAREERRRGSRARGNKSELKEGEKNGKKKKNSRTQNVSTSTKKNVSYLFCHQTASPTLPPPVPPSGRSSSRPGPGGRTFLWPRRASIPPLWERCLPGIASERSSAAEGPSPATLFENHHLLCFL